MRGGGGKSGGIEQRAAADGDEIRMPVEMVAMDVCVQFADERGGIFGGFAAGKKQRRADGLDRFGVDGKIFFNLRHQLRQRLGERIFQHDERFARRGVGEGVAQNQIFRRKNIFGEENAQRPADLNGSLEDRHGFNLTPHGFFTRKI